MKRIGYIPRSTRRGLTSMLAMLYLVLFTTLAVGFYAATTTTVQLSSNEAHGRQAMLDAESGLDYVRYTLGNVDIAHFTDPAQIWPTVCQQVYNQLDGTANFGHVQMPVSGATSMPLPTATLPDGGKFTATLSQNGEMIDVTVVGVDPKNAVHRTIKISFARATRASAIFDYGVASKSAISMGGKAMITGDSGNLSRGSVLADTTKPVPLTMTGNPQISGDFSYTNASGNPSFAGGKIAGYSTSDADFAAHVHAGVLPPEFPTIDTSSFEKYVPAKTAPVGPQVIAADPPSTRTNFTNVRIKAGANPHFSGGSVITGVLYIETPNNVTFSGGVTVNGVIVVQNSPTGDTSTNTMSFRGNVTHNGVETLDNSNPAFAGLKDLSGSFLLAPTFAVDMKGTSNAIGGTIVTSKLTIGGTAGANVKGTVINLGGKDTDIVDLTGTADIIVSSTGTTNYPAGVSFGTHYAPLADTYQELQ
jgi:hypothetical protein